MKKLYLSFIAIGLLLLTGCEESKKEKLETEISKNINIDTEGAKLVCTTDYDYSELNYTLGSKYVVFADDKDKVTKVISGEVIYSTDKTRLDDFENYLNQNHDAAAKYNGYTYNVEREKNKVTSSVTIDYSEFDMKKFLDDNESTDKEELTLDSIEKKYVSLGAKCERKND
jgi:hypothetical protein